VKVSFDVTSAPQYIVTETGVDATLIKSFWDMELLFRSLIVNFLLLFIVVCVCFVVHEFFVGFSRFAWLGYNLSVGFRGCRFWPCWLLVCLYLLEPRSIFLIEGLSLIGFGLSLLVRT